MADYPPMVTGVRCPLPRLSVASHADWIHVDLAFLCRIIAVLAGQGVSSCSVISGYRSPDYSASVGGYSTDPHTRGVAIDAYIGGTPIGDHPGMFQALTNAGLESGATPGFYRGGRDPEHVQIRGSGINKGIHAGTRAADLPDAQRATCGNVPAPPVGKSDPAAPPYASGVPAPVAAPAPVSGDVPFAGGTGCATYALAFALAVATLLALLSYAIANGSVA